MYFFLLLAALYALVVGTGSWFVMQSERRQLWRNRLGTSLTLLQHRLHLANGATIRKAARVPPVLYAVARTFGSRLRRHRATVLTMLALLLGPVLFALYLSQHAALEGYDDSPRKTDPVITALLEGEQLVPPPSLPPQVFVTREVETLRPELNAASREWMLLESDFRQRLLAVYRLMAKRGYQMALIEGYRSPERQSLLARLGSRVTNAAAFQSYHQYGLAADSAFYRDGKLVISEKDAWAMEGYRLYGEYAESVGLVWGGRWQMMDFGHVEFRKAGALARR